MILVASPPAGSVPHLPVSGPLVMGTRPSGHPGFWGVKEEEEAEPDDVLEPDDVPEPDDVLEPDDLFESVDVPPPPPEDVPEPEEAAVFLNASTAPWSSE